MAVITPDRPASARGMTMRGYRRSRGLLIVGRDKPTITSQNRGAIHHRWTHEFREPKHEKARTRNHLALPGIAGARRLRRGPVRTGRPRRSNGSSATRPGSRRWRASPRARRASARSAATASCSNPARPTCTTPANGATTAASATPPSAAGRSAAAASSPTPRSSFAPTLPSTRRSNSRAALSACRSMPARIISRCTCLRASCRAISSASCARRTARATAST